MGREPDPMESAKTVASLPLVEDDFDSEEPPELDGYRIDYELGRQYGRGLRALAINLRCE